MLIGWGHWTLEIKHCTLKFQEYFACLPGGCKVLVRLRCRKQFHQRIHCVFCHWIIHNSMYKWTYLLSGISCSLLLFFCHVLVTTFYLFFSPGQGLLSQSALQLNNQDSYAAAGYHNSQGLESVTSRHGQVGGAVHIYNQVNVCGSNRLMSTSCDFWRVFVHQLRSFLGLYKHFNPGTALDCKFSWLGNWIL